VAIPLLAAIDLTAKDITADALLTQRKLADYLVTERHGHYHFTVKGNQPTLYRVMFSGRGRCGYGCGLRRSSNRGCGGSYFRYTSVRG
jgi:hypothetical protein